MKKILCLVPIFLICQILCACGKSSPDFNSRTFDFFSDSFHWDMTIQEAEDYIQNNQTKEDDVEIEDYVTRTIISDDYYIFGFDGNEKMEFVKVRLPRDERLLDTMIEEYGNCDLINESLELYTWYGTMNERNVEMTLDCSIGSNYLIEFCLKD